MNWIEQIWIIWFLYYSRCYNCGEFANHIAAKCNLGPQPKRCHHCKASDHLIADCTKLIEKRNKKQPNGEATVNGSSHGNHTTTTTSEASSEGEENILNAGDTGETASSSEEEKNHLSDSGLTRSIGKTPTTDDTKSDGSGCATSESSSTRGHDEV